MNDSKANRPVLPEPLDLDNCAREPIHIPGLVQPHGALLAFDASGRVTAMSANASTLLGVDTPAPGELLESHHFDADPIVHAALSDQMNGPGSRASQGQASSFEVTLGGRLFDLIVHRHDGKVIAEFEQRPGGHDSANSFALKAHRAIGQLRHEVSMDALLGTAVRALRELTGFDRVMAYRFHSDDSGEVVAEERLESLQPFLGQRYPASDIPAQARRLYLLNPLRLIADVHAVPVALVMAGVVAAAGGHAQAAPLDMSHCVLRSVSPVHLEYLVNIGVAASMSISIVVGGRLWGMLACHHGTSHRVPYAVRMACDVLTQIVAAHVQNLAAREQLLQAGKATALRARILEVALHTDDSGEALASMSPLLTEAFAADAVLIVENGKLHIHGALARTDASQLIEWLAARELRLHEVLAVQSAVGMPGSLQGADDGGGAWCGLLATRYDDHAAGWLVMLRKEQVTSIVWGREPNKGYPSGPLGARLTPQGSMAAWAETVTGTAKPWSAAQLELGRQVVDELARAGSIRMAEISRARAQLLAMLGHDLRDPLHAIAMAATVLERAGAPGDTGARLGRRIQSSSRRMERLIGLVLDASMLQNGIAMRLQLAAVDLSQLVENMVDEARTAHPDVEIVTDIEPAVIVMADADRLQQLIGNLLSNARQHGTPGEPVIVQLTKQGDAACIDVSNSAPPLAPALLRSLYSAFQHVAAANERNRDGLGLGLHIAHAIARSHGGWLQYSHAEPYVMFTVRMPLGGPTVVAALGQ